MTPRNAEQVADLLGSLHRQDDLPPLTVSHLAGEMARFVAEKGWTARSSRRPQTPRNLAVSLMLEAGELLECFQWGDAADVDRVRDEVADVLLYLLQLGNVLGIDIGRAALDKIEVNRTRVWDAQGEAGR